MSICNDDAQVILEFGVQTFTITDYTRYQEMVLMRIFKACQKDISDAITSHTQHKMLVFSAAENSEQMRHRRLPLKALEPNSTHYNYLKNALIEMSNKPVLIPYRLPSHAISYQHFDRLFKASFSRVSKYDYVDLDIPLDVLRRYLSNDMGYHRLSLKTYFSLSCFASRKLLCLYHAHFAGSGRYLKVEFLGRMLSPKNNYTTYADVARYLLEPSRKEMERMYQKKLLNIHFKYKPEYELGDDRTQEPEKVKFFFMLLDDEKPQGVKLDKLTNFQESVRVTLKLIWGLDERVAQDLAQRIKLPMVPEASEFFNRESEYRRKMQAAGRSIINPAGFIRNALVRFLQKWQEEYEGLKN